MAAAVLRRLTQTSMRIMPALRINATASAAVLSAPRRTLCTSSRMMSSDAIEALRAQLKVEMEHEEDRKPTLPTTIGDYTVKTQTGSPEIVLQATKGNFEVEIKFSVNDSLVDTEDDFEDEDDEQRDRDEDDLEGELAAEPHFMITINNKKSPNSLVMTGVADAEFEFSPDRIAIVPKGATPEQIDQAYSCNPQYLDEDLSDGVSEFLHGLGIDSEFIEKATQLCEDKELSEYQAWLKQFSDFVR